MNRGISLTDWGLLLAASVLVGSTFLFINIAVEEISPLVIAALRALISALICWIVMRASGVRLPRTRQGWTPLLLARSADRGDPLRYSRMGPAAH